MAVNTITDKEYQSLCDGGFKESMVNELKQVVASINSRKGPGEEKLDYDDLKTSLDVNIDMLDNFNMADDNQREQVSREVIEGLERNFQRSQRGTVWLPSKRPRIGGSNKQKTKRRKTHKKRKTHKRRKTHKSKRRNYRK